MLKSIVVKLLDKFKNVLEHYRGYIVIIRKDVKIGCTTYTLKFSKDVTAYPPTPLIYRFLDKIKFPTSKPFICFVERLDSTIGVKCFEKLISKLLKVFDEEDCIDFIIGIRRLNTTIIKFRKHYYTQLFHVAICFYLHTFSALKNLYDSIISWNDIDIHKIKLYRNFVKHILSIIPNEVIPVLRKLILDVEIKVSLNKLCKDEDKIAELFVFIVELYRKLSSLYRKDRDLFWEIIKTVTEFKFGFNELNNYIEIILM